MITFTRSLLLTAALTLVMVPAQAATTLNKSSQTTAPASTAPASYLDPSHLTPDILAAPPPAGSKAAQRELDTVVRLQSKVDDKALAAIKKEATLRPALMTYLLGKSFSAKAYPKLFALLDKAQRDTTLVATNAKTRWAVKRPYEMSDKVKPLAEPLPTTLSYPSEYTATTMVWAEILSQLKPELSDKFKARANAISSNRVKAGMDYPVDQIAGRNLAWAILREMEKSDVYKSDLAAAKDELSTVSR